jgi:hypothetical protein
MGLFGLLRKRPAMKPAVVENDAVEVAVPVEAKS